MKKIIYSSKAPEPIGPYSQAMLVDGVLYISGQIPINALSGNTIPETIEEQTHQVMRNLSFILAEADMSYEDIIKCSIFITDMNAFPVINEIYGSYFQSNQPVRETVEVSRLPKDVLIEISCIASK